MTMPFLSRISLRVVLAISFCSTGTAVEERERVVEHDLALLGGGGQHQHHAAFASGELVLDEQGEVAGQAQRPCGSCRHVGRRCTHNSLTRLSGRHAITSDQL